ncbi:MAG TPA: ATP-dependent DNA helicase RecG [Erysipelothrix sp.]
MKLTAKQQTIIKELGYDKAVQMLFHFPIRYEFSEEKDYSEWQKGDRVIFHGSLFEPPRTFRFARNQSVTNFKVSYQNELISCVAFNRPYLKAETYREGITVTGIFNEKGAVTVQNVSNKPLEEIGEIKAIYATKQEIKQYEIVRLIKKLFAEVKMPDILDAHLQEKRGLLSRDQAMRQAHFPKDKKILSQALFTLKYEEFLVYHLSKALQTDVLKGEIRNVTAAQAINHLPFNLRADQSHVYQEILSDLNQAKPMRRLVQGDVGSGKTVVALLAALSMIEQAFQVAFLVPTEVLLYQHFETVKRLFPQVKAVLVNQFTDKETLLAIEKGRVDLVLGTHTLFQDKMKFKNLGLAIIDEQQRFGVKQREALVNKGEATDLLMLSATPIPQTLAQSLYMDLDVSTLTHSRQGKVETHIIKENSLRSITDTLGDKIAKKEQIYIVCPAIEESEVQGIRNVFEIHENLSHTFPQYRFAVLHGKMSSEEKEAILKGFQDHQYDILISTSVIEVGIDVHNANTMIIYNAEQFGLATLHQMRGRVGRGQEKGVCYLLSDLKTEESITRLKALEQYDDGFKLSEIDLQTRGMGDLLGVRQSGMPQFHCADIFNDVEILKLSKEDAAMVMANKHEYAQLLEHVRRVNQKKGD